MYSVNETIEAKFLLLHPTTGLPVTGATVVSTLYDETDTIHSYPTVTEIGNGLYTASFVPDTAGEWTIIFGCSTPVQSGGLTFPVGLGNVASKTSIEHSITTANDTVETEIEEIEESDIYSLSVFLDLDTLETASEGGIVTIRLYNKIDGSNYADLPVACVEYVVGSEIEYPSIETNVLSGYSKITISCSGEVTATRSIVCRILKRNL